MAGGRIPRGRESSGAGGGGGAGHAAVGEGLTWKERDHGSTQVPDRRGGTGGGDGGRLRAKARGEPRQQRIAAAAERQLRPRPEEARQSDLRAGEAGSRE